MEEQTLRSTGQMAPFSHFSGKSPIIGTFATPGIRCTNSYLSPHGTGVGDHRFQLHDFDAGSVLGIEYPLTVRPNGRTLRCDRPKTRKKYNKRLQKQLILHRSFEKLELLQNNHDNMLEAEFRKRFDNWDNEVTQQMIGSENRSNQFYSGHIAFSPEVGVLTRMLRAYRWLEKFKLGKTTNKRSLLKSCRKLAISSSLKLTLNALSAHFLVNFSSLE